MVKKIMVGSEGDLVLKDNRGSFASVGLSVVSATIKLSSGLKGEKKNLTELVLTKEIFSSH